MIEKLTDGRELEEDKLIHFRPQSFSEFIGQAQVKENTETFIQAALNRREALDHVLLSGPPGLGKTTFSLIIAREMGANLRATTAPAIEKTGDIASLLSSIKENDILFIDEIHRLKPVVEEVLYGAMEDYHLDISLGQGSTGKTVRLKIPPFTLIGATTKAGSLSQPLISRFGIISRFNFYLDQELEEITFNNSKKLKIDLAEDAISEIAKRSRGTPRILNRLLKRIRDFADVKKKKFIDKELVDFALSKMSIDKLGLEKMDRDILSSLIDKFGGGPVGVDNLATTIGEDTGTIEEMYEPFLIQIGLIKRTARGRVATEKAFEYLKKKKPVESNLFDNSLI